LRVSNTDSETENLRKSAKSADDPYVEYFKALAEEAGIPYQDRINLYLRERAHAGKKPALSWAS
jgi:hypothetical protein